MEWERITDTQHPRYAEAMRLYADSFPLHEQREAASEAEILKNPAYHFDVVCDGGAFVGEILSWEFGALRYVEHFCVLPAMRSRGYGQKILSARQDRLLLLEIDPPVDAVSRRRKGFYERCGLTENPYPHIHPPYHAGNEGHPLVIMSSPRVLTPKEYEAFRTALRDTVMAHAF